MRWREGLTLAEFKTDRRPLSAKVRQIETEAAPLARSESVTTPSNSAM
jgi:hypothetical protein